jgi:alkylated DNA repair dioxygenase AlkB
VIATAFNHCIVQCYPAGAGIGWHTDAPVFGDTIMGISFGAGARLQFRPNGENTVWHEVQVVAGSLYVMAGEVRWDWQHRVVPVKSLRYSLTVRSA